ncbi:MAG: NIPSNAP family protein [Acidobacteria bacterium]|nr:NIPSNAP family protein [Acidobacteriota bacterium]
MLQKLLLASAAFAALSFGQTPEPSPSLKKTGKFYELRIYHAFPGKLEDVHNRFRQHTNNLFVKHGMEIVGFWGPTDKEKGAATDLIYVLAYPSREARDKSWKAFAADPDWAAVRKSSEANGKLVEKVDSVFMGEVDYFTPGKMKKK